MSDTIFKIGDRVKIINCSCIESYELNKVGVIVRIKVNDGVYITYIVDMGRPRRPGSMEDTETCWYLRAKHIELISKLNQQLEFSFMNEKKE